MGVHKSYDESQYIFDVNLHDDEELHLTKRVATRKRIEQLMEKKRLREEFGDGLYGDNFDWGQFDD